MIKGSEKPDEYIIISSHLDYVGVNAKGEIFNGAHDDGSGTVSLLEIAEGINVIGEASGGQQAVEQIPLVKPDVVLLDMRMPGMTGLDVLHELKSLDQLPPTILLTTFDDDEMVLAGVKSGAMGYCLKDVLLEEQ
mgnify:CR=1 FL=1